MYDIEKIKKKLIEYIEEGKFEQWQLIFFLMFLVAIHQIENIERLKSIILKKALEGIQGD